METKQQPRVGHTPGPWGVSFGENAGYDCMTDAFDITAAGKTIAVLDCGQYGQEPCAPLDGDIKEAVRANARLIAAAPDLLTALKTLLSFDAVTGVCDEGPIDEGWKSDELIAALARADEAIAKAKGHNVP